MAEASNGDLAFEVFLEASRPPLLVVDKVAHVVEVTVVLLQPFSGVGDAVAVTTEEAEAVEAAAADGVVGVVEAKSVESEAAEPRFNSLPLLLLPPPTTLSVAEAPGTVKRPLLLRERSLRLFEDEVEGLILF